MLRLVASETHVDLNFGSEPEFDDWRWIDYWKSLSSIVFFKRQVYEQALSELAPLVRETTAANLPLAPVEA